MGETARVRLPVMPPVAPMLAKAADALPEGDGWLYEPKWDGFRCIVFRDGDEVELGSRNERPLTRYFPELPPALAPRCRSAAWSTPSSWCPARPGSTSTPSSSASTRRRPGEQARRGDAGRRPRLRPAGRRRHDLRPVPLGERRRRLEEVLAARADRAPLAVDARPRRGPGVVQGLRGGRARRDRGQAHRAALPPGRAGDGQGEASAHRRLRRRRVPVAQGRRGRSARCCSASTTPRARSTTSACAASFTAKARRELVDEVAPLRDHALDDHPWRTWAEMMAEARAGGRMPGVTVALERAEGSVVGAAATRAGLRGDVHAADQRSVPPQRAVPALATRPGTAELPLRPARGGRAHGAGGAPASGWVRRWRSAPSRRPNSAEGRARRRGRSSRGRRHATR